MNPLPCPRIRLHYRESEEQSFRPAFDRYPPALSKSHTRDSTVHLCHTSCMLLEGGSKRDIARRSRLSLSSTRMRWSTLCLLISKDHPSRTSSILLHCQRDRGIAEPAGLAEDWPILQGLITSDKRVTVFMGRWTNSATVPYILSEFEHVWERFGTVIMGDEKDSLMAIYMKWLMRSIYCSVFPAVRSSLQVPLTGSGVLRHGGTCKLVPGSRGTACYHILRLLCHKMYSRAPNFVLLDWVG